MSARSDAVATAGGEAPAPALLLQRVLLGLRPHLSWFHALMLVAFVAVLSVPLIRGDTPLGDGPFATAGELAAFLLWGVWLPLLFVSAIIAGRAWCGVLCPMGAVSEWMSKIGLQREIPGWLKWSGVPLLSFLAITLLNESSGADENPAALATLFGSLFVVALAVGLVYGRGKRAWCRHACPIGMTMGISSRLSALSFEPKRLAPGGERYTEKTLCPTMIDLRQKTESRHCLACGRCVHPQSRGGLALMVRRCGSEVEQVARMNPSLVEVLFVFCAIGISLAIHLEDVPAAEAAMASLGEGMLATALWFLLVDGLTVAALLAITSAAAVLLADDSSWNAWRVAFYRLGYSLAPVAVAALICCMCGVAFETMQAVGVPAEATLALKGALVLGAGLWSLAILHNTRTRPTAALAPQAG